MTMLLQSLATMAMALSSLTLAAPASSLPAAKSTPLIPTVLSPVSGSGSFYVPDDRIAARQVASVMILSPITSTGNILMPADSIYKRASVGASKRQVAGIMPSNNVTLDYKYINSSTVLLAQVNATMKHPSVLLEDIPSVTKVDYDAGSVNITFAD
ncbi:hypothetical protein BP6252_06045 [Coleophoma cylindrospora]|uniref:Uncharacterized protein n=1 Tax=Coleophoma cylindrospora TaxID=1849047 RepID=A0A3D8RLI7_9HELO|nr:hypothetical protein BP6252_06045 [Coleophoma cylindrospora]